MSGIRTAYKTLGNYCVAVATGDIAAGMAANGELFQFRWTNTTNRGIVYEIGVTGMRASTAFAVGNIDLKATTARAWTAAGTGGTALTLTGDEATLRTDMGTALATARVSTTAALGAGTKTLDTQDLGLITTHSSAGWNGATPLIGSIYLPTTILFKADMVSSESPLILEAEEGFVVRGTVPATGVWNLGVVVKWIEALNI